MLNQVIHWIQMVGTVLEGVLLVRLVSLKLQRVYLWVTLYWAANLLVDVSAWVSGWDSPEAERIFLYTRFLFAALYPLAAWDVFEEIAAPLAKLRKAHALRLVSGLFVTSLLGFIFSIGLDEQEIQGTSSSVVFIGLFLWMGSACASLLFTANVWRSARKLDSPTPHNTWVWTIFFLITFGRAILDCAAVLAGSLLRGRTLSLIEVLFSSFDVCLTVWCLLKLKALPSDAASISEKATS